MRLFSIAGFCALAAVGQAALAAPPACIRPADARAVLGVALPDAIEALAKRCGPALPADSYLRTQGAALADRYRREAPVDPARARKAIEAVTGRDLSDFASDDTVLMLADQFVGHAVKERVATRDCDSIDGMVALAAPMRADAMAEAILLALEIAGPEQTGGYAICQPGAEVAKR
ncbi:MAG TPA: hypothetical protein VFL92_13780 [Sphingomonas sp.]|nr:hypothetical protein [Sphingomonas sp.]